MELTYVLGFLLALLFTVILTPLVKRFALYAGVVDKPNHRKVHTTQMPRLGGVAIYLAFAGALLISGLWGGFSQWQSNAVYGLLAGGTIIVLIGALDDKFELSAKVKFAGQLAAAAVVVIGFDLKVQFLNIPFGSAYNLEDWISIPLTIFWIVGVTNAINLIDGLDGLAAGVSGIATATMLALAIMMGNVTVAMISALLLGGIIGFLFFNFHPAKIFMGDSGALFLGFALATLSILGFKQATVVSLVVPILILGVPLSDTFFAIVRRVLNKTSIATPDKSHLHHCLLQVGFSHRQTVLIIYGMSFVFAVCAVVLSQWFQWLTVLIVIFVLLLMEVAAEAIGIISRGKKPVLHFLRKLQVKTAKLLGLRTLK